METLLKDLHYGFRVLSKNLGFTVVAIITIALGIGANTAIFSVVNAILLRPLGYNDPTRIVMAWATDGEGRPNFVSPADYVDWREQNQVFEHMATMIQWDANLGDVEQPERIQGVFATLDFFRVLGAEPILGRGFLPEDLREGYDGVVVLGHELWQRQFSSDPNIIGKTISLSRRRRVVVGIMPPNFNLPILTAAKAPVEAEIFAPMLLGGEYIKRRDIRHLRVIARLKSEVTIKQAQAGMELISRRLEELYPATNKQTRAVILQLHDNLVGSVKPALLILVGAVGFVLLIACANVANLLLIKGATRQKELAVRIALGASRMRLTRQLLTESLLLFLIGGGIGALLAVWTTKTLVALSPGTIPRLREVTIDGRVLGFTLLLSMVTGVVFGLVPALQASKSDPNDSLKEGGRLSEGSNRNKLRQFIIVSELSLSFVLLVGAGLMIKSLLQLSKINPGFDPKNVLTMQINLPRLGYPDNRSHVIFYQRVLERIPNAPGVEAAGLVNAIPLSGWNNKQVFGIEGRSESSKFEEMHAVSSDYFKAMHIPILKGRVFTEYDNNTSENVVIVSDSMARRYWNGEDPIGKRIKLGTAPEEPWRKIVGVVGDVKQGGLGSESNGEYYLPYLQHRDLMLTMALVVRTSSNPLGSLPSIRREILSVDKDLPLSAVKTADQVLTDSISHPRINMLLMTIFAGIAFLLTGIGVYGVIAYSVKQRTREIGVRIALGARPRDITKLVLVQGLKLAVVGVSIGIAGAAILTRVISRLLFEVSTVDPGSFVAASVLLVSLALLGAYLPARRAQKVNPTIALRAE
jgi:putative ABC transport system permease protein